MAPDDVCPYPTLEAINFEVNADIRYRTDMELYQLNDFWTVLQGKGEGDCDDYAMTKRFRLLRAGVPLAALRLAVVFTETDVGRYWLEWKKTHSDERIMGDHAILIVTTERGDFDADNRFPTLTKLSETGYDLDRIQVKGSFRWNHGVLPASVH